MSLKKEGKWNISVRPPKGNNLKERLQLLADKTERSMNYHAIKAIELYLQKNKIKN